MSNTRAAKYQIGQVVRHRIFPFRGVVFDIDPIFNNTEEWYQSIPAEVRPSKDQPFYHLFAENADSEYIAYVSEQNLLPDTSGEPVRHPQVAEVFVQDEQGSLPAAQQPDELSGARPREPTAAGCGAGAAPARLPGPRASCALFGTLLQFILQLLLLLLEHLRVGRRTFIGLGELGERHRETDLRAGKIDGLRRCSVWPFFSFCTRSGVPS